jgi:hypothetical protein
MKGARLARPTTERTAAGGTARVVYPQSFVGSVPSPARWELRPVSQLLRGQHSDPEREIERIERWYSELQGPKDGLLGRLRSLRRRDFWAGLAELLTSRVFVERGWQPAYEAPLGDRTPDFTVHCPGDYRFIAEVLAAFHSEEDDKQEAATYAVASALDRISHRLGVVVNEVAGPVHNVNLKGVVSRVQRWLDQARPGQRNRLHLEPPEAPITLTLSTSRRPRSRPEPIVIGVEGPTGRITAKERLHDSLSRKVEKYGNSVLDRLPLVLFVWEGDWMGVTSTSVEWALFGTPTARFSRVDPTSLATWSRTADGLFGFGKDGRPRCRPVSAVAYCSRVWYRRRVYARVQVYHHPYTATPLSPTLFQGVPQLLPVEQTADECILRWDRPHRGLGLLLH